MFMDRLIIIFLIIIYPNLGIQESNIPKNVKSILNDLEGEFKWAMIRPSNGSILLTGSRSSKYWCSPGK